MTTKEQRIERVEIKKIYVANDGTEFQNEEECRKYEQTAKCTINAMFKKLKIQRTENVGYKLEDIFALCYEDNVFAVKIENVDSLEIVNKWICSHAGHHDDAVIGNEAIGTIQLIDVYDGDYGAWVVGTPDDLKKQYCDAIDKLYNKLVDKTEEETA